MTRPGDIGVVGIGMVSSIGHDVNTSCASARAGITRPSGFARYEVRDSREAEPEALTVHAVDTLTYGFSGRARLLRLLVAAIEDVLAQYPDKPWLSARVGVFISLPSWARTMTGALRIQNPTIREALEQQARETTVQDDLQRAQNLLRDAGEIAQWGVPLAADRVFVSGTTGTAEAVQNASAELGRGTIEMAIVVAVDSWIDVSTAGWLEKTARLKTPDQPVGLQPGEAAAVVILETQRRSRQRGAVLLGVVDAAYFAQEQRFLLRAEVSTGRVTAELLDRLRSLAGWSEHVAPWIITDQNGEADRASEWGNTLYHLVAQDALYHDCLLWYPALSFGDTGSASGGVAICMALRSFARNYAPHNAVVIANSSDGPGRSVMLIRRA